MCLGGEVADGTLAWNVRGDPELSIRRISSSVSNRMPENPSPSPTSSISAMARTTSTGNGSPTDTACDRTMFRCNRSASPGR